MCDEYTIYAMRGRENDLENSEMLHASLIEEGEGRFGWSYIENADLYRLREKVEKEDEESLSEEERDCYHDQKFLLDLKWGDYVIYINVPEPGKCTLAHVTGPYRFRFEDRDFNHRFPVDPRSVRVFDRNSVHPSLSERLKLRRRWWRIRDKENFEDILNKPGIGKEDKPHTPETRRALLKEEIEPFLERILEKFRERIRKGTLRTCFADVSRMSQVSAMWSREVVPQIMGRICWSFSNRRCSFEN